MTAVFSSTSQMMRQVIYALVLGISAAYAFFGWGIIHQGAILGIEIANKTAVKIAEPSAIAGLIGCFLIFKNVASTAIATTTAKNMI
jgi:hypothetical protein